MKTILAALNAKFVHSNLAIRYIKAYCQEYDIELYETSINDSYMDTALDIIDKKPDIVGFSCYIWNVEGTLKVASIIKEVLPNTKILLGGPEVTYNSTEYLENYPFLDYVIQGEGEVPFRDFLRAASNGYEALSTVQGLSYKRGSEIIENKAALELKELDEIPFPYEDEIPSKIVYYEASRGCPFNCSYCLSGAAASVRYFSLERVKRDLMKFIEAGTPLVKFVDRTFNANRKFAVSLWEFLIENRGTTRFHFEIAADLLDEGMLELLQKAPKDLFQFEIGVQSTNIEILKNINRVMDFKKVKENIIRLKSFNNIHCHMDLIAGLPGENIESFIKSFEDCMEIKPEVLQLGFLKVLKGSKVYSERDLYDIHHIKYPNYQVLYTMDITYENMRRLMDFEKVFETYYNSGIFKMSMNLLLEQEASKFLFFDEFRRFLEVRGFFERKLDLRDKFKLLYEYAVLKADEYVVRDILIYDFVINTKKSVLPDFLKKDIDKGIKEAVNENRDKLSAYFSDFDIKKVFGVPMDIKILTLADSYYFEISKTIVIFDLNSGDYCYLY